MGDNITKPDHYCEGREYEPKDVIRDWGLNFNLGSCVKYISRAGRKGDKLEDLQKAKQFLEFEIEAIMNESKSETKNDVDLECFVRMVLDGSLDIETDFRYEKTREKIIDRIVEGINNGELAIMDIPTGLYMECGRIRAAIANRECKSDGKEHKDDIGMTCKEAAAIGDAIAKGFKEGFKETEEKHDESELDIYCRGFDAVYDMLHTDLRSVEDTFTFSFKVEED